ATSQSGRFIAALPKPSRPDAEIGLHLRLLSGRAADLEMRDVVLEQTRPRSIRKVRQADTGPRQQRVSLRRIAQPGTHERLEQSRPALSWARPQGDADP